MIVCIILQGMSWQREDYSSMRVTMCVVNAMRACTHQGYCKMIWYLIECRIIPGVWSSSWHGDTGWEEEKAGQGAGGEGEEDEGLASTEKL